VPVPFARAPLFPLCLAGPVRLSPSHCLVPSPSLSTSWASPVSSAIPALAKDQRARTRARRRNSRPRRLPTRPSSLFEPRPCPHSLLPPHFAQPRSLARSAHAVQPRRRPVPTSPVNQLAGGHAQRPRAPPRGETSSPMLNFPSYSLSPANFDFASVGVTPHWSHTLDVTKTPPTKLMQHKRCNKVRKYCKIRQHLL
jgi:hypothetical protein